MECFLWSVGVAYEPQYKYCREGITKLCILLTTIDDIYDIYATLDEAKLFTNAVERFLLSFLRNLFDFIVIYFSISKLKFTYKCTGGMLMQLNTYPII